MAAMSYGKRMLKAGLQKCGSLKKAKKRLIPDDDAQYYCDAGIDKDGFKVRYISDYKGFGVFAESNFTAGEFLLQYCGEKISEEEGERRLKKDSENKCFFYIFREKNMCIDAEGNTDHICQFVNDADDCNAIMKLKVFHNTAYLCLFAKKDIVAGNEILYDYGESKNLWWRKELTCARSAQDTDSDPFDVNADQSDCSESYVSDSELSDIVQVESGFTMSMSSENTVPDLIQIEKTEKTVPTLPQIKATENTEPDLSQIERTEKTVPTLPQIKTTEYTTERTVPDLSQIVTLPDQRTTEMSKAKQNTKSWKRPNRYCIYCQDTVQNGKLKRHITRKHKSEEEVQEILKQAIHIQNKFFDKKRREGIYEYNTVNMAEGKNPVMRERKPKFEDQLRYCVNCKSFLSNKYFSKHKCVTGYPVALKPQLLQKNCLDKLDQDIQFKDILNRFRDGAVGDMCRTNQKIKMIGYRHFNLRRHEEGKQDEVRKVIMAEMREISKLFITFKSVSGESRTVEDMFQRQYLPDLEQSIEQLVSKDNQGAEKHGQKLFLDAVILRALKTLMGYYSETIQDEKRTELKHFKTAYKHKSCEIYPSARQSCVKNSLEKARKPENLPNELDIQQLKLFIENKIKYILDNYELCQYAVLRSLVVARLTLYNARRGEEAARMLLTEWEDAEKGVWLPDEAIEKVSDPAEQYLIGKFKLAYLKGKGRKYVPVLVPTDLMDSINKLIEDRFQFGIRTGNIFLFATKNGMSHCSGWHAVAEVCQLANVHIPVNATKMRHRLSTVFASLDMGEKEQKIFLDHMGHDIAINKENYQCPQGIRAVCVMGQMLNTVDKGNCQVPPVGKRIPFDDKERKVALANDLHFEDVDSLAENNGTEETSRGKSRNMPVKWSMRDTKDLQDYFKDFLFVHRDKPNNKGNLPCKNEIMHYLQERELESLATLTVQQQYLKIRAKLFNERKTIREKICGSLKSISSKKYS